VQHGGHGGYTLDQLIAYPGIERGEYKPKSDHLPHPLTSPPPTERLTLSLANAECSSRPLNKLPNQKYDHDAHDGTDNMSTLLFQMRLAVFVAGANLLRLQSSEAENRGRTI
jgi:hypothetical protein